MRRTLACLLVGLAVTAAAAAAGDARRVSVVAWASKAPKTAIPPGDAVSGGTYCKPRAIRRLYAFIRFSGMRDKVPSSVRWLFNGKQVFTFRFKWEDGDAGRTAFNLYRTKGTLEQGTYGMELRSAGRLLATGSVKLRFGSC